MYTFKNLFTNKKTTSVLFLFSHIVIVFVVTEIGFNIFIDTGGTFNLIYLSNNWFYDKTVYQ